MRFDEYKPCVGSGPAQRCPQGDGPMQCNPEDVQKQGTLRQPTQGHSRALANALECPCVSLTGLLIVLPSFQFNHCGSS